MEYTFDPKKAASNVEKHGVAFQEIERFQWEDALVRADTRDAYGEVRLQAIGVLGNRIHLVVYTIETRIVRLISLRPASKKEIAAYASAL